jgi:hypothetical protein
MLKSNPEDEADYYYNIARKEEEEKETPEERAKYKLEAKNEKIWNRYMYVYPYSLSIRDIADQQDISLVRAYQIVLDYGGIERLQQASDYKEVNGKLKQENILKLAADSVPLTINDIPPASSLSKGGKKTKKNRKKNKKYKTIRNNKNKKRNLKIKSKKI